jgi:uncharacterized membrane protein
MFLASAIVWSMAPERIPVHWNINGQVDRYGGKWEGLLLMPVVAAGIYLLMLVLPRIDPGRANYDGFQHAYRVIRLAILAFLALFHAAIIATALGCTLDIARLALLANGVLLLVLGNVMGKIRPNWFCGIRTPWTLSSKLSWTRTHRMGGRLFVLLGLLTFGATFLPPPWNVAIFLGPTLLATAWLVIYSYLVWRRDPDRVPPSGTTPAEEQ